MSDRFFDPSDAVDIPDEAEPWENRPDAVRDRTSSGAGWDIIRDEPGLIAMWTVETEWLSANQMVALAHAILSEVEIGRLP